MLGPLCQWGYNQHGPVVPKPGRRHGGGPMVGLGTVVVPPSLGRSWPSVGTGCRAGGVGGHTRLWLSLVPPGGSSNAHSKWQLGFFATEPSVSSCSRLGVFQGGGTPGKHLSSKAKCISRGVIENLTYVFLVIICPYVPTVPPSMPLFSLGGPELLTGFKFKANSDMEPGAN